MYVYFELYHSLENTSLTLIVFKINIDIRILNIIYITIVLTKL